MRMGCAAGGIWSCWTNALSLLRNLIGPFMKKHIMAIAAFLFAAAVAAGAQTADSREVKSILKRVADWEIANHVIDEGEHGDLAWTQATLYVGMLDWARLVETEDGDDSYYQWMRRIGRRNSWQTGKMMYHADDIAVSQAWLAMYEKYRERNMLLPTLARTEFVLKYPSCSTLELDYSNPATLERWSWCDALFMAPPVYARMYVLTGRPEFLEFMDREYKASYSFLYDTEERLFYRDWRYFDDREANGEKVFWGRGNGWVLAGLAELLQILPPSNAYRDFYEELFVGLALRLAELQNPDGYWHASLLDPASYPSPETSATGFIVYGLAYGVNAGLLDARTLMPVILKGWNALTDAVGPDGKLGYVQPIGADPRKVSRDMTEVYGVGAFLAAGVQLYEMLVRAEQVEE